MAKVWENSLSFKRFVNHLVWFVLVIPNLLILLQMIFLSQGWNVHPPCDAHGRGSSGLIEETGSTRNSSKFSACLANLWIFQGSHQTVTTRCQWRSWRTRRRSWPSCRRRRTRSAGRGGPGRTRLKTMQWSWRIWRMRWKRPKAWVSKLCDPCCDSNQPGTMP